MDNLETKDTEEMVRYIDLAVAAIEGLKPEVQKIKEIGERLSRGLNKGGTIFIMGNGGSAAQAQHFAAELMGRFEKEREPVSAIALTANSSNVTAIGNDYGYDYVFSRQLELAKSEDMVIGLSTSGNSKNVIEAIKKAKDRGCYTLSLTGKAGLLKALTDENIAVNSTRTATIQETHNVIIHLLSKYIEDSIVEGRI